VQLDANTDFQTEILTFSNTKLYLKTFSICNSKKILKTWHFDFKLNYLWSYLLFSSPKAV